MQSAALFDFSVLCCTESDAKVLYFLSANLVLPALSFLEVFPLGLFLLLVFGRDCVSYHRYSFLLTSSGVLYFVTDL